jgi:hypothetical protein
MVQRIFPDVIAPLRQRFDVLQNGLESCDMFWKATLFLLELYGREVGISGLFSTEILNIS